MYARYQATLAELTQAVLANTHLSTLMRQAVTLVAHTLAVAYSAIWELLPSQDALVLRAGIGWREATPAGTTMAVDAASSIGSSVLGTAPVIVTDDDMIFPAIRAGALGYTLKDFGPAELVRAIQRVARGESSLHPAIARRVLQELTHPPQRPLTTEPLTEREVEVLRLVAHGESNRQIATALDIGEGTVRVHVRNILSKLHLASRTQAALYALREGLASLDNGKAE